MNIYRYLAKPGAELPVMVHMRGFELNCDTTNCNTIRAVENSRGANVTMISTSPLAGTIPACNKYTTR